MNLHEYQARMLLRAAGVPMPDGDVASTPTEAEAIAQYGEGKVKVYRSNFAAMYNAITPHRALSRFKLVCAGANEKVVGLHGIGEGMDEVLQGFAVATRMGATKAEFDSNVAMHPTSAEEFVTLR